MFTDVSIREYVPVRFAVITTAQTPCKEQFIDIGCWNCDMPLGAVECGSKDIDTPHFCSKSCDDQFTKDLLEAM